MESGTNSKRLKVVWLCHLNNDFISDKLGVKKGFEFAPWMARYAEIFKKNNELDIYIVSPYSGIKKTTTIQDGNIVYSFFPISLPLIPKRIQNLFHFYSNYIWNKYCIKKIVNKINPDIIHLFGTENPYYSTGIFQFRSRYPVLITIQGIVNQVIGKGSFLKYRKVIEKRIIGQFNDFGVRDEVMTDFIKGINKDAKFHYHEIAPYKPIVNKNNVQKKYDLVFFARVCKQKGIEDLIQALVLVKEKQHTVNLVVIGPAARDYISYLKNLCKKNGLEKSVYFLGAQKSIEEVHNIVSESKICVLPTHADTIPGTILESMFLGVPCVSYPTGGIPTLNDKEEIIKLVKKGNIQELADAIIDLIYDGNKRDMLAKKAMNYVETRWDSNLIKKDIENAYQIAISAFNN